MKEMRRSSGLGHYSGFDEGNSDLEAKEDNSESGWKACRKCISCSQIMRRCLSDESSKWQLLLCPSVWGRDDFVGEIGDLQGCLLPLYVCSSQQEGGSRTKKEGRGARNMGGRGDFT